MNDNESKQPTPDNPYADIIDLPHHHSTRHPPLPMSSRAAQFGAFAALSGYGELTGELTEETAKQVTAENDK